MTVDAARVLAADVWNRARGHDSLSIRGLNSEEAVRRRLAKTARRFKKAIDWMRAPMVEIGESAVALYQLDPSEMIQLVVIQALAARLGHWMPTEHEIDDAATAHRLAFDLGPPEFGRYRNLLADARRLRKAQRYPEALQHALAADRLVRTAPNLVDAAVCLTRMGDQRGALWSIRAALLEPRPSFGDDRTFLFAERLHERLSAVLLVGPAPPTRPFTLLVCSRDIESELDADQTAPHTTGLVEAIHLPGQEVVTLSMIELPTKRIVISAEGLPDEDAMADAFS
jgi:hypothetical protein